MKTSVKKLAILLMMPMFGAIMFVSKLLMEGLPNIHLLALFIVVLTVVFRAKALIAIYIFVLLTGLIGGFGSWWIPYLYIWALLWLAVMLLPQSMSNKKATIVYATLAALHGILFGVLYAPVNSLVFGMDFKATIAWVIAGLPFDAIHMVGNFLTTLLAVPLINVLIKAVKFS